MPIKRFGTQIFLNPADSPDSGWVKLSVKGTTKQNAYGKVNTRTLIADCSQQIELDFDVWGITVEDKKPVKDQQIKDMLAIVKARRAKATKLRKAMLDYTDALLAAYDVAEAELKELQNDKTV